jgi:hypothetical protein
VTVKDEEYLCLRLGDRVLWHDPAGHNLLRQGVVARHRELSEATVAIGVSVARGPEPSEQELVWPDAERLHRLPLTGMETCHHCAWRQLEYLAGDKEQPFTGAPPEQGDPLSWPPS